MQVLILSANTGGGHNSTAVALSEYFKREGVDCETVDALKFISDKTSEFISWGHSYVYRKLPLLFGLGYRFEEKHSPRFIYEQCARGTDALWQRVEEGGYDAIICVHAFAGMMVTELRRRYGARIPAFFVATDYTCSPGVSELEVDGFFIPHRMLLGEFVHNGIAADKLITTGIPVRESFYEAKEPRAARLALGLPEDRRVVLFSCGSMGCGRLDKTAALLSKSLPKDAMLVVICGNNQKAYDELNAAPLENVKVIGFTEQMPLYMSAADLYVTKPGGLTTSEAIVKCLPMVFFDAVPGLETKNFDFLVSSGVAVGAKSRRKLVQTLQSVLKNDRERKAQVTAMREFQSVHAAEQICRHVIGACVK